MERSPSVRGVELDWNKPPMKMRWKGNPQTSRDQSESSKTLLPSEGGSALLVWGRSLPTVSREAPPPHQRGPAPGFLLSWDHIKSVTLAGGAIYSRRYTSGRSLAEVMADGKSHGTFAPVTSGRFLRVFTPGALVRREAAPH